VLQLCRSTMGRKK